MNYDPLDQAQLDRLCAGFQGRIRELESTIGALDDMLETAAAKIEELERRLAEAQNLAGYMAAQRDAARGLPPLPDPSPTPPIDVFGWKYPKPRADK